MGLWEVDSGRQSGPLYADALMPALAHIPPRATSLSADDLAARLRSALDRMGTPTPDSLSGAHAIVSEVIADLTSGRNLYSPPF